ncbi:hypothetical protein MN608_09139 [Microdochium nivale]|nr:hypothetical protein MN608_09139 [Microdochium nivale]
MDFDNEIVLRLSEEEETKLVAELTNVPGFDFSKISPPDQRDLLAFGEILVAVGRGDSLASSITEGLHNIVHRASLVLEKHPTWDRTLDYAFWRIVANNLFDMDELEIGKPEDLKALLAFYTSGFREAHASTEGYCSTHISLSASTAIATWIYLTEHEDFPITVVPHQAASRERDTACREKLTKEEEFKEVTARLEAWLLESQATTRNALKEFAPERASMEWHISNVLAEIEYMKTLSGYPQAHKHS